MMAESQVLKMIPISSTIGHRLVHLIGSTDVKIVLPCTPVSTLVWVWEYGRSLALGRGYLGARPAGR
jgi:hypothetical protein